MAAFIKGDIVVLPFPFSDLSEAKRRPALVVATLTRNDLMLCMITSQSADDRYTTAITDDDFIAGGLSRDSFIKANRVFIANEKIIAYKAGTLTKTTVEKVISKLIAILRTWPQ